MVYTNVRSAAVKSQRTRDVEIRGELRCGVSRGTYVRTSTKTPTANGTLTKRTDRQPRNCTKIPPNSMPAAIPLLPIVPHNAIARERMGPAGNIDSTIASAAGLTIAAPRPCSRAHRDQEHAVLRETAEQRRDGKDRQAYDEKAVAAVQVGAAAGQHQKPGQKDRVGADDPLSLTGAPYAVRSPSTATRSRRSRNRRAA